MEEGGWPARLGIPETRVGTGLSDEEIGDFAARVDLGALRAYRQAVHERTTAVLDELQPEALGELLDPERLERLFVAPDGFGERAATLPWADTVRTFWRQAPRGWFLSQGTLIHPTLHVGELRAVASLSGWRGV